MQKFPHNHLFPCFLLARSTNHLTHLYDTHKQATLTPPPQAIIRAEGAQQNGFENLGIFAAGVVAGNAAGLDAGYLNALSIAYVASRIVYDLVYINNTTPAVARVRSVAYNAGSAVVFTLFVSSGNALRRGAA